MNKDYAVGFDFGDRSVGVAFVEFDGDVPVKLLRAIAYRHDGGENPSSKTPESRKAAAGVARRVRRMRRERRRRLNELDRFLRQAGYPIEGDDRGETYEPWNARANCVTAFIENEAQRRLELSRAIRHMARHRGWRDPWHTVAQELREEVPSSQHQKNVANAQEIFPGELDANATVGQLGAVAGKYNRLLRPRTNDKAKNRGVSPVLSYKVLQRDQLDELKRICSMQRVSEDFASELLELVFGQKRPVVRVEGRDELPGMSGHPRAPRSSLEFQEFRIRDSIANLRVKSSRRDRKGVGLASEVVNDVVDYLLTWREPDDPTWAEVAEFMSVDPDLLVAPIFDDVRRMSAPVDRTSRLLEKTLSKKAFKPVLEWWNNASTEQKSMLVALISDPTDHHEDWAVSAGIADVISSWPDGLLEELSSLNFESGRSAYSLLSLKKMNDCMATRGCNLHDARKEVFDVDDSWRPTPPKIHEPVGHPTVDCVLPIVRRTIMEAHRRWGVPRSIHIEHTRSSLLGPAARAAYQHEVKSNREEREKNIASLREQGVADPTAATVRRFRAVQHQNGVCLYCGSTITAKPGDSGCELDHVVPRSGGGSSRRENLVAVCRRCNSEKGNLPFGLWAATSNRPEVSVEAALTRLKNFNWKRHDRAVRKGLVRRLKQTSEDEPIDERSLESTAYAATEIRRRLQHYFDEVCGADEWRPEVFVLPGAVTREARRAGGFDSRIKLRGKDDKDRFDARHHALDAAIMTVVNRSVARTLQQRSDLKYSNFLTGAESRWKEFKGDSPESRKKFERWVQTSNRLADLVSDAIVADAIPVIFPLRLGTNRGRLHEDKVKCVDWKSITEEWSKKEIERIVSPNVHAAVTEAIGLNGGKLSAISAANVILQNGKFSEKVAVARSSAACIQVNGGVVGIGKSIHHARLFAWVGRGGAIELRMVRVFTAELPYILKNSTHGDVFTAEIPSSTYSFRDAQVELRKKLLAGEAVSVGWITQNDEIEIDVDAFTCANNSFAKFLKEIPETRWCVDGFNDSGRVLIRPAYLSAEGLTDSHPKVVRDTLDDGQLVTARALLSASKTLVIRRTALGAPRWKSDSSGLPVSFSPLRRAEEALK
ncbi:type II CRISPR RNA-guided endonuclease Cas9 [Brevibacterium paucivorans]